MNQKKNLVLKIILNEFTVHRFSADAAIPKAVYSSNFLWIGKTDEELSIVCDSQIDPGSDAKENGWRAIKVIGPLEFSLIGIVSDITTILAKEEISVFVNSTYNTDYILVRKENLSGAVNVLSSSGYSFTE